MKLSKKLLKNFSVIAVVSILLTAVFSTAAFWFVFSDEQEAEVRQYTDKIISVYNSDSEIDLSKYYGIGDFRVTLIKSDGSVVSDSVDTDVNSMPNHSDRPEFEQAIKDGNGSSHRMSETLNKITYYYAEKTADGSVIRVAKTIDSIYGIFLFVIPSILIIMIGVFVVCTILAKRSTKKIIEPIKEMADNGNGSPYDELLPLSQKIASQQRQIKRQMRRLQFEKDKISTLIENMAEGFILIDVDKKVLMSNYSASKLLGADDDGVTDKTLIAFSRNEVLNDCVDKALSGESKNGDTTVKGRALQIITNPVYSNGEKNGAICLIIDVSAKKKAEKMRREFTANVTHELKTPLTSISGYAEIIASGLVKPDDIPNFANKIHKESGRLLSLISDIMELSQLDEKFSDEEFAPVDLAGVAAEVAEDLRSNAEKHGITITVDTKTAVISGNRNQIYELIYNLCDNAIRYNRENGSVKIITGDDNEHPFVKVADTGIGIPEKHHKRVFERFYRVDKSRSKEQAARVLDLQLSSTLPKDTAERFLLKAVNREQHLPQCSDVNIFTILCRENKFQAVLCILYCAVPLFYCLNNTISRISHKKYSVLTNFKDIH